MVTGAQRDGVASVDAHVNVMPGLRFPIGTTVNTTVLDQPAAKQIKR